MGDRRTTCVCDLSTPSTSTKPQIAWEKRGFVDGPRRRAAEPTKAGIFSTIRGWQVIGVSVYETLGIPADMGLCRRRQCRQCEMHILISNPAFSVVHVVTVYGTPEFPVKLGFRRRRHWRHAHAAPRAPGVLAGHVYAVYVYETSNPLQTAKFRRHRADSCGHPGDGPGVWGVVGASNAYLPPT